MTAMQKSVPALRFKDGQGKDYPDWEEKKLGAIGHFIGGGTPDTRIERYWKGNVPWISSSDIGDDDINNIRINRCITKEAIKNSATKIVPANSILFISRVGIGKLAITNSEICTSQDFTNLTLKSDVSVFIGYLFQWNKTILLRFAQGTSIKGFTSKDLKNIQVFLPAAKEQQKIATFLSSVDAKIEQLTKRKALLEQYKKGMMQKLFSQEIRFKDEQGEEYPDWKEVNLDNLGKTFRGLTGKNKEHFGRGERYIQYLQVFEDSKINLGGFGLVEIRSNESQNAVQYGDVFFTTSSETPTEVGITSVLLDDVKDTYLNSFCFGYRINQERLLPEFARYAFRQNCFRKEVVRLAQGSTRYIYGSSPPCKSEAEVEIDRVHTYIRPLSGKMSSPGPPWVPHAPASSIFRPRRPL